MVVAVHVLDSGNPAPIALCGTVVDENIATTQDWMSSVQ